MTIDLGYSSIFISGIVLIAAGGFSYFALVVQGATKKVKDVVKKASGTTPMHSAEESA